MSVRATSQPIGAATTQQISADSVAMSEGGEQRIEKVGVRQQPVEVSEA